MKVSFSTVFISYFTPEQALINVSFCLSLNKVTQSMSECVCGQNEVTKYPNSLSFENVNSNDPNVYFYNDNKLIHKQGSSQVSKKNQESKDLSPDHKHSEKQNLIALDSRDGSDAGGFGKETRSIESNGSLNDRVRVVTI